jgi:membrane associated rhomboid family serine protease
MLIGLNGIVFLLELGRGEPFITRWALVPSLLVAERQWITVLTAMFLHGGWAHILGNMLFLKVFGPGIEDVMGAGRYLVFYLLGGGVASLAQVLLDPESSVPILGASGAIAAVMGAFLVTYPHDRIRTLFFFGWFAQVALIPAVVLVGLWFLIQLFSEVGALVTMQAGGVAYMAHIGGFLFGAFLARLFEDPRRIAAQRRLTSWGPDEDAD